MSETFLRVDISDFRYHNETKSLFKNISLTLNGGSIVFLIGDNGSGKSSLLSLIAGVLPQQKIENFSGEINWSHAPTILYHRPSSQILTFRVDEEITFPLGLKEVPRTKRISILKNLKEEYSFNIDDDKDPRRLSSGEQQKLVALSLTNTYSKIYLFDEPDTFLDQSNINIMKKLMVKLGKEDALILVSTHKIDYYTDIANEIYELKHGVINRIKFHQLDKFLYKKGTLSNNLIKYPLEIFVNIEVGYKFPFFKFTSKIPKLGIVLVKGKNGSGKTSLLMTLASIIKPIKGKIEFDQKVIFVPVDTTPFFWRSTVREEFPQQYEPSELLKDLLDISPFLLSEGQRKLVAIELAFTEGELILVDEPTQSLDKKSRNYLLEQLIELSTKKLIILATNDFYFIELLSHISTLIIDLDRE